MFGVLIPVGPDQRDLARLHALIEEIDAHENREEIRFLVVDDAPRPRALELSRPDSVTIRTPLWERGRPDVMSAHVAGTLEGLNAARDLEFVVKLDTDAAIVAPFSSALREVFLDPQLGVVGSYNRASDGGKRDWSLWRPLIDRADRTFTIARNGGRVELWRRSREQQAAVRALRRAAYAFAVPGAHCLGGAYAVSSAFTRSAALDWRPWIRTRLGEDVVIGVLCSAAKLRMKNLNGDGEPFSVAWRGLAADPAQILAAGHSIVHSVKREDVQQELTLRARLQQGR